MENVPENIIAIMQEFDNGLREAMGLSEDWTYNSWPLLTEKLWKEFCNIAGEENLSMVSLTVVQKNGEFLIRPSFFINSIGRGNISLAYPSSES